MVCLLADYGVIACFALAASYKEAVFGKVSPLVTQLPKGYNMNELDYTFQEIVRIIL